MRHAVFIGAILVLSSVGASAVVAAEDAPASPGSRWSWTEVPRVVALGDLHGSFGKLVRLLRGADVVDAELRWTAGADHLVVNGDFLDRGVGGRAVMDLLMRLERESEAAGGRAHVLLGNHEVMNLLRDTRKVHREAYRDFAAEETAAERRAGWAGFQRLHLGSGRLSELGLDFHRAFPRGFFARQRAFDADGRYGRWLLGLPAIVKVNGVVYLHGGLTEEVAELGLDGINLGVARALERHLEARDLLEREGAVEGVMRLFELRDRAEEILEQPAAEVEVRAAAGRLLETADDPLLGSRGPLWYRGTSLEDERIERQMLERSLDLLDARAMVVAHSYTGGNRITSRFHGRLYRLDHGILQSDRPLALVVERGEALVLDPSNGLKSRPIRELPPGGVAARATPTISDAELERFLSEGEVIDARDLGRGSTRPRLLRLSWKGDERRGIHKSTQRLEQDGGLGADRYQHEVAAYRLDRMIGLGMVPVTVLRAIDGVTGSLQWWVEGAVDREAAGDYDLAIWNDEAVAARLARGRVFDALIGNHYRRPSDILTPVRGGTVYLIDHSKAFSIRPQLPATEGVPLTVEAGLVGALRSLDRPSLVRELGELLSAPQIDALLERRDRLLELSVIADG